MFDFLKDTNKRKLFIFNYCVFMINGLLTLSVGSLLPFIRSARGIGYGFAGLIVSLHSVGNLVACFVAGALPAVIGKKKNILFRGVQLRKHSKAREKRYSFGYAVSFIFACYQILWTFPKSRYLCSRYLPLVCG